MKWESSGDCAVMIPVLPPGVKPLGPSAGELPLEQVSPGVCLLVKASGGPVGNGSSRVVAGAVLSGGDAHAVEAPALREARRVRIDEIQRSGPGAGLVGAHRNPAGRRILRVFDSVGSV